MVFILKLCKSFWQDNIHITCNFHGFKIFRLFFFKWCVYVDLYSQETYHTNCMDRHIRTYINKNKKITINIWFTIFSQHQLISQNGRHNFLSYVSVNEEPPSWLAAFWLVSGCDWQVLLNRAKNPSLWLLGIATPERGKTMNKSKIHLYNIHFNKATGFNYNIAIFINCCVQRKSLLDLI